MLDIARLPRCDHHGDHLPAGEHGGEGMARFVDKDHENFNRVEKRRMPEEQRHETDGEENQQLAEVQ